MITAALEAGIKARREDGWRVDVHPADATSRPEFLARHVYELLRRALEAIHGDDDAQSALPPTATDTDKLTPESLFEARSQRRMLPQGDAPASDRGSILAHGV